MMRAMPKLVAALGATAVLLAAPAATAKDFGPRDLLLCGANRCMGVTNPQVLRGISVFYYFAGQPSTASAPELGARAYELRFRGGYVTGIVAADNLDTFLSYGVNMNRFTKNTWYAVPAQVSAGLRHLAWLLRPLHVTAATLQKSH
jgi:hypothetical protein